MSLRNAFIHCVVVFKLPYSPSEQNHSWESDGWDSNYFGPKVVAGGSCTLVAEHWHGKPMVQVQFPAAPPALSCSFAISEVFGRNGLIQRSSIRPRLIDL